MIAKNLSFQILHQCDVEVARNMKSVDDGMRVTVIVSPVDLKLSVSTVATLADVSLFRQKLRQSSF